MDLTQDSTFESIGVVVLRKMTEVMDNSVEG